jgi:hypothetical protein
MEEVAHGVMHIYFAPFDQGGNKLIKGVHILTILYGNTFAKIG